MPEPNYEYTGLLTATWDLLRGDTSDWPDRPFYSSFIESNGEPALDVGCATGRLLLDNLNHGIDIDGVDLSPEMVRICRQKAADLGLNPNLYEQSIAALDLPRRYRSIIVSSSTFQLITDPTQAEKVLNRLYEHLQPDGSLVMSFMILGTAEQAVQSSGDWELLAEAERSEDGAVIRRWARSRLDFKDKLEHTEDRFEVWLDNSKIQEEHHARSPATRWYRLEEAEALYHQAGFTNVRSVKGFTSQPATDDDSLFCVLGTKPEEE